MVDEKAFHEMEPQDEDDAREQLQSAMSGSIADGLEAALGAMQYKKAMQLIESGALICGLVVELNVPCRGRCTIDRHGRVVWSN